MMDDLNLVKEKLAKTQKALVNTIELNNNVR